MNSEGAVFDVAYIGAIHRKVEELLKSDQITLTMGEAHVAISLQQFHGAVEARVTQLEAAFIQLGALHEKLLNSVSDKNIQLVDEISQLHKDLDAAEESLTAIREQESTKIIDIERDDKGVFIRAHIFERRR